MNRDRIQQEHLCLQTKYVIDKLRTNLLEIEDFHDFSCWDKRLKKLKSVINDIYWQL